VFRIFNLKLCCLFISLLLLNLNSGWAFSANKYHLPSGEALHDPTKPEGWGANKPKSKAAGKPSFTLNYIHLSADQKRAIVNGKKVRVGDYVSSAKVTDIQQNTVTLLVAGKHKVLRLNKVKGIRKN